MGTAGSEEGRVARRIVSLSSQGQSVGRNAHPPTMRNKKSQMIQRGRALRSRGSGCFSLLTLPTLDWNAWLRFLRSMCEPACESREV